MPDYLPADNNLGTLKVGSFIGGTYRVLGFIGQGGMGFVYKVEHMMMAKTLALKVLRPEQVTDDVWKRFRIEAQAIARLDHINVVRIYDMSQTEDGLPFYTMDLLDGESLADYLDEYYRLPLRQALPIFRQVCAGLAYAHDRGIVHRDIKPGNIMLLTEGKDSGAPLVKIVDFGIAKLSSFDSGFGQGLTRPGEVFGSPLYMSPEQCSGQQLDHRTDMYSVGVTMFQALTGRPPLLGKTAIETTAMHQNVVPPAMAEVIALEDGEEPIVFPAVLEKIVARLLAKSPDDRFDSLADVAVELLALEQGTKRSVSVGKNSALDTNSDSAPYTMAGSGRLWSETSRIQDVTSGQSETGAEATARKQVKTILSALAAVVLLTLVIGAAVINIWRPTIKTEKPDPSQDPSALSDLNRDPALNAIVSKVDEVKQEGEVTPQRAQLARDYLASHKQFYSIIKPGNPPEKTFVFPSTFSIGRFGYGTKDGIIEGRARGQVNVGSACAFELRGDQFIAMFPAFIERFRDNELVALEVRGEEINASSLLASLGHSFNLKRLVISGSSDAPIDLKWLDKFMLLEHLEITGKNLDGLALAKSKCLPTLQLLRISRVKNATPLLKRLSTINNLTRLDVEYSELGRQDCLYLAKMTKLTSLSLKGNAVTDDELKALVTLLHLKSIDMRNCDNFTLESANTFSHLKELRELSANGKMDDPNIEQKFRLKLPNLKTYRGSF